VKSIHIYTKNSSARQEYIFRIFFDDQYTLHTDPDTYIQAPGYHIAYANEAPPGTQLHIIPEGLLCGSELRNTFLSPLPALWSETELPARTDIFALAFFIITRLEEYHSPHTDQHGRFLPQYSILAAHNMHIPWIDVWRSLLWDRILYQVPATVFNKPEFRVLPSFDIDHAYAFRGKGFLKNTGGLLRDLFLGKASAFASRLRYLSKGDDPYDTYSYIHTQLHIHKLRAVFFLLCGWRNPPYDTPVNLSSAAYQQLLPELRAMGEIGLHPSYASHNSIQALQQEYHLLQSNIPAAVSATRQHFLRIQWPDTYRRLLETGIRSDYTMGYASQTGFRAGTCRPFSWFDPEKNQETPLRVYPFSCMDGTLNEYLGLSPEEAIQRVHELRNITRRYNGVFVSLWHNHSLSNRGHWKGWRPVFEDMLRS